MILLQYLKKYFILWVYGKKGIKTIIFVSYLKILYILISLFFWVYKIKMALKIYNCHIQKINYFHNYDLPLSFYIYEKNWYM